MYSWKERHCREKGNCWRRWIRSWLEQSGLYFRVQAASPWHICTYIPSQSKKENNENFNYVLSLRGEIVT